MVSPDLGQIDLTSHAFIRRLANLLRRRRRERQLLRWQLAHRSGGAFTSRQLHDLELGQTTIDGVDLRALAALYDVDLATIFPERMQLDVDLCAGILRTSGVSTTFDPYDETSLLTSYLRLVRDLRAQHAEPTIELRRDDVEVLASTLGVDAMIVIDRLGDLMGSTVTQRRAAVAAFVTGAAVIVLAGGATAATSPADGHASFQDSLGSPDISIVVDEDDQPTDGLVPNGVAPLPAPEAAAPTPTPAPEEQDVVAAQGAPEEPDDAVAIDDASGEANTATAIEDGSEADEDTIEDAPPADEDTIEDAPPADEDTIEDAPPADDSLGDETPEDDTPGDETPSDGGAEGETPADEAPSDDTPDETPGDEASSDDTPEDDTPEEAAPAALSWTKISGSSNIAVDEETGSITFTGSGERRALIDMAPVERGSITLTGTQMTRGNGWGVVVHGALDDRGRFEGYTVQLDPGLGNRLVVRHWGQGREHAPIVSESPSFDMRAVLDVTVEVDGPELRVLVNGVEELYVGSLHQAAAQANSPHEVRTSGVFGLRAWSNTDLTIDGAQLTLP